MAHEQFGMAIDRSGKAICAGKTWAVSGGTAGVLLYGFGTRPPADAVCTDGIRKSLENTAKTVLAAMDTAASSASGSDLRYVWATTADALRNANDQICSLSAFLGQGLYIGGTIVYIVRNQYFLYTFGGAASYIWDGSSLVPLVLLDSDGLIRDALGNHNALREPQVLFASVKAGSRLILTSLPLPDERSIEVLQGSELGKDNPNTVSLLLKQELESIGCSPAAVMEICSILPDMVLQEELEGT